MTHKKKVKAKNSNNPNIKRRAGTAKAEINAQSQSAEEVVYYYSDSEMISYDGSRFAEAVYEFDQGSGLDRLDVTLGEVTISFDLATKTTLPISEQDQAKLQQYAQSQDLQLVQDVSVALLQNQEQFADLELLFGFLAIAMLVDPAEHVPLEETALDGTLPKANLPGKVTLSNAIGQFISTKLTTQKNATALQFCSLTPKKASISKSNKLDVIAPLTGVNKLGTQDCFGCCGYGCYCLPVSWGGACAAHDRCVRRYGLVHPFCNAIFPFAIAQVRYGLWR